MKTRVMIYGDLSSYEHEMINKGFDLVWEAIDSEDETLFSSKNLKDVIEFSNKNKEVSHIDKYVEE